MFGADAITLRQKLTHVIHDFRACALGIVGSWHVVFYRKDTGCVFGAVIPRSKRFIHANDVSGKVLILRLNVRQAIGLLLMDNNGPRGHIFPRRNFDILNQAVHHHNGATANAGIKHRRSEANKTVISHISGSVNQRHVRNRRVVPNPNGVTFPVVPFNATLLQAMNNHAILKIGATANVKRRSFIRANRSSRRNQNILTYPNVTDQIGKNMHIGRFMNIGFCKRPRPRRRRSRKRSLGCHN